MSSCPFFPESHINTNCALVCIQGQSNESLKAFFDFFSKHASVLTRLPNELFRLASNSRNIYIKGTLHEMQHKTEVYLEEWYQRIKDGTNAKDRDAKFSCLVRTLSLTEKMKSDLVKNSALMLSQLRTFQPRNTARHTRRLLPARAPSDRR